MERSFLSWMSKFIPTLLCAEAAIFVLVALFFRVQLAQLYAAYGWTVAIGVVAGLVIRDAQRFRSRPHPFALRGALAAFIVGMTSLVVAHFGSLLGAFSHDVEGSVVLIGIVGAAAVSVVIYFKALRVARRHSASAM